jgi:TetR/AcrR family transcriptional regulator, lmrAB and yxaGH operons repressor
MRDEEKPPRERLLAAAAKLFQKKGYGAAGLNEILAASGSPKGSLYYYFPGGKLQLAIEAVEYAGSIINAHVASRLAEFGDSVMAFQAVLADIIEHVGEPEPEFDDVSLSMIALEVSSEAGSLREACKVVFEARERLFVEKLSGAGYPDRDARRLGSLMQVLIEGAVVAAQTRSDASSLAEVSDYIPTLLAR